MPRAKMAARRPRLQIARRPAQQVDAEIHVDVDGPLPDEAVLFIESIPEADAEPPAKRQKQAAHREARLIEVYRDEITIVKGFAGARASRHPLSRPSLERHLDIRSSHDGCPAFLLRHPGPDMNSSLWIPVPDGIPEPTSAIIRMYCGHDWPAGFALNASLDVEFRNGELSLKFVFRLLLAENRSYLKGARSSEAQGGLDGLTSILFPDASFIRTPKGSPQEFYKAAHVTAPDMDTCSMAIEGLTATLYPFQRRAVCWLLQREGVQWRASAGDGSSGDVFPYTPPQNIPISFMRTTTADGNPFFFSPLLALAVEDAEPYSSAERAIRGGILAEEMGLGKTLEIIGLMLMHGRPSSPNHKVNSGLTQQKLRPTGATLIITPPTLRDQWMSEITRHAPELRVMVYTGMVNAAKDAHSEAALIEDLARQDVVIMTYVELRREIFFAITPPDRSRRHPRKYHRPTSPLMQLSWWRVCLDEAQEIDSGVSNAAILARMIPRVNAWAVTGTPVKDDLDDLRGLLLFLHHDVFSETAVWNRMTRFPDAFHALFNQICLRHSKQVVRNELKLPTQKRYVINIPFNAVEEQYYQRLFRRLVRGCNLSEQGEPTIQDWRPDDHSRVMRNCLDLLRKAALHPHVGAGNQVGGRSVLRTAAEVLDFMLQEADASVLTSHRALLLQKLTRGQLLEDTPRKKEALAIWQEVLKEVDPLVQSSRDGIQAAQGDAAQNNGEDEEANDGERAGSTRIGELQRKLRYALEIQHKAEFFSGNAFFQIKSDIDMTAPESEEFKQLGKQEDESYARAKSIRQEILQEAHRKACRLMDRIEARAKRQEFAVIPEMTCDLRAGIETRAAVDSLEVLSGTLNEQADQLDKWREQLIHLLCKPLVDEDEDVEVTGDEYGDSTKAQEEIMVHVQVIRAALADRQAVLSGQAVSKLVLDETKASLKLAKEGEGPAPEKLIELLAERAKVEPKKGSGSLRGLLGELRGVSTTLRQQSSERAKLELEMVDKLQKAVTKQWNAQSKALVQLDQEVDAFTAAMNARVDYYRQLQEISDDVAPYEGPKDDRAVAALVAEEKTLADRIAQGQAEQRYLMNLKYSGERDEVRICPICQNDITNGVITMCGHQFDKDCLVPWLTRAGTCPTCKRRVRPYQLHPFQLKPQTLTLVDGGGGSGANDNGEDGDGQGETGRRRSSTTAASPGSRKNGIYSAFNSDKLAEIKAVPLDGPSFTTKVDAIVRHLLWLRESDPGSKSIIFSQYTDFFGVLSDAFKRYHIGFSSMSPTGIQAFKEDPGVECFLLHARAQSSGLNLVNASHVVLCEPLLNTALELQAIARVDRIGQQQDTTVWLYIVEGTVEESIYDLSVQRRLEHMGRNLQTKKKDKGKGKARADRGEQQQQQDVIELEIANSMELQQASLTKLMRRHEGRDAGEEIPVDDLWTCIFGHIRRRAASTPPEEHGIGDRVANDALVRARLMADAAEERLRRRERENGEEDDTGAEEGSGEDEEDEEDEVDDEDEVDGEDDEDDEDDDMIDE